MHHTSMTIDLKDEAEFTEMLMRFCHAVRSKKRMPHLAGIAAKREMMLAKELEELNKRSAQGDIGSNGLGAGVPAQRASLSSV